MNRIKTVFVLAVLLFASLSLLGLGGWLYSITDASFSPTVEFGISFSFNKPYGILGLVMFGCGALVFFGALGTLFDLLCSLVHEYM